MVIDMKILVDADACPVKNIIEAAARKYNTNVVMITDSSHVITSSYSEVVTVSQGKDSADISLINMTENGDIVVTQDYGVAAMALGKGAYAIGNSGLVYDENNIDKLLFERFLSGKIRRSGKKPLSGPHKRTSDDDLRFKENFEKLLMNVKGVDKNENI